nr:RNA polymerase sigma factor [Cohnella sp. REN36]
MQNTNGEDEREWIRRVLAGNADDYRRLVDAYKNRVYGLLRGMGANHQDAQDLTQETFVRAYRKLASHDETKRFAAWLYRIAHRLLIDHRRSAPPIDWTAEPPQLPATDGNPEEALLRGEHRSELRDLIGRLPENYRAVVLLRYTNELSYEEIGEVLGVPVGKVQNDLHRAKRRLKQWMTAKEETCHDML